jgi:hypothetical protein
MEWVLQVVDEIDDAIAMLRHGWLGWQGKLFGVRTRSAQARAAGRRRRYG